jgi:hypothetical protein
LSTNQKGSLKKETNYENQFLCDSEQNLLTKPELFLKNSRTVLPTLWTRSSHRVPRAQGRFFFFESYGSIKLNTGTPSLHRRFPAPFKPHHDSKYFVTDKRPPSTRAGPDNNEMRAFRLCPKYYKNQKQMKFVKLTPGRRITLPHQTSPTRFV